MLNQRLQQKLLQKLSPQQILLMKLLQIPSIALEQRIKQEIEENPALDESSENEAEEELSERDDISKDENEEFEEYDSKDDEFDLNDYIIDPDEIINNCTQEIKTPLTKFKFESNSCSD